MSTGPPSWRCRRLCCIFHLSSSLTRGEIEPVAAASITAHPICSSSSEVAPADHAAVPPQPPGGDEGAGDEGQPSGGDAGLGDDTEGASCRQYSLGDIGMAQGSGEPSIHPPQGEHSSSNRQKELRDSRGIASWCVLSRTETLYFILFCDPCSPRAQMSVPVALPTLPVSLSISPRGHCHSLSLSVHWYVFLIVTRRVHFTCVHLLYHTLSVWHTRGPHLYSTPPVCAVCSDVHTKPR